MNTTVQKYITGLIILVILILLILFSALISSDDEYPADVSNYIEWPHNVLVSTNSIDMIAGTDGTVWVSKKGSPMIQISELSGIVSISAEPSGSLFCALSTKGEVFSMCPNDDFHFSIEKQLTKKNIKNVYAFDSKTMFILMKDGTLYEHNIDNEKSRKIADNILDVTGKFLLANDGNVFGYDPKSKEKQCIYDQGDAFAIIHSDNTLIVQTQSAVIYNAYYDFDMQSGQLALKDKVNFIWKFPLHTGTIGITIDHALINLVNGLCEGLELPSVIATEGHLLLTANGDIYRTESKTSQYEILPYDNIPKVNTRHINERYHSLDFSQVKGYNEKVHNLNIIIVTQ